MPAAIRPHAFALMVGSVALGGAAGTLLRDLALRADTASWYVDLVGRSGWAVRVPWILMAINLVGVYFATLALRGPLQRHDANNLTRLLIITGFFGGFTSYSSLFVSLGAIWHVSVVGAILTTTLTVLAGVGFAWLGARSWSA
ncbi:MAG: CrcB family protein [Acidobacteriota bacterium]|nr:CrcB family protein [Acidobacteriota bacterium]MDE3092181.1 CrcB family protein [Acidobacteriota bacterium]